MNKRTIEWWTVRARWSDGTYEEFSDVPDDVAQYIDDYLTEVEEENA